MKTFKEFTENNLEAINEYRSKAEEIRKTAPGYVGGKDVAMKASDEQIVQLTQLMDEKSEIFNRKILPIKNKVEKILKDVVGRKKANELLDKMF